MHPCQSRADLPRRVLIERIAAQEFDRLVGERGEVGAHLRRWQRREDNVGEGAVPALGDCLPASGGRAGQ